MTQSAEDIYRSANGDRWTLIRDTNSGRRLLNAGDLDGAISQFRSATSQLDTYAPAHFYLAQALRRKGLSNEAERELERASELDPHFKSVPE